MATTEEVQKLAALARVEVAAEELERFTREFDAIVAYIGQLEKLDLPKGKEERPALRNVLREDGEPRPTGASTEKLVEQFPAREGDYLVVKQVILHE